MVAVHEDVFWELLDRVQPLQEAGPLVTALAVLPAAEILAFQQQLAVAAHALNKASHHEQGVTDAADVDVASTIPLGDDAFLSARLAVVAAGRHRWEEVVLDPALFAGAWDLSLGDDLAGAAEAAYERVTGDLCPPFDLDSPPDSTSSALPPPPRWAWFHLIQAEHIDVRRLRLPRAYKDQLRRVEQLMNSERSWWTWWDTVRGEPSTLRCHIDFNRQDKTRSSLRTGRSFAGEDEVVVQLTVPVIPGSLRGAATTPLPDEAGRSLARAHLELLRDVLRRRLDVEPPSLSDADLARMETGRRDQQRARSRTEPKQTLKAYQRQRSSEHIWRGRAPDHAVAELVAAVEAGKRLVALPQMIAALRHTYAISALDQDAAALAEAGYSQDEIEIALASHPAAR